MAKAFPLLATDPEGTFVQNAPLMLHIRLGEMYRLSSAVPDPTRVEGLHAMRIAAKRLRYTMEIFEPCFSGIQGLKDYKYLYTNVKSIQERIGDIHDCDVRMPALNDFLIEHGKRRPEIKIGLQKLIEREQAQRDKIYVDLVAFWAKLEKAGFRRRFERALLALGEPTVEIATAEEIGDTPK